MMRSSLCSTDFVSRKMLHFVTERGQILLYGLSHCKFLAWYFVQLYVGQFFHCLWRREHQQALTCPASHFLSSSLFQQPVWTLWPRTWILQHLNYPASQEVSALPLTLSSCNCLKSYFYYKFCFLFLLTEY